MSGIIAESATNLRHQCLQLMWQLQRNGGSLTRLLPAAQLRVAHNEQAQLQAWIFGWCRWTHELSGLIDPLLDKPFKARDLDIYLLIQLGVFQLRHTPIADYAAVDETVKVVKRLKKPWARGLVNAVLRNYQRQRKTLESGLSQSHIYSHPEWLLQLFQTDWPSRWQELCEANNKQAPMCLRVNPLHARTEDYQRRLSDAGLTATRIADPVASARAAGSVDALPNALLLDAPAPVSKLPGFENGDVSVQDAAAQLAGHYLAKHCQRGGRLLDACAAPGGKTAHAAESGLFSHITAIDHDDKRLDSVTSTLQRLQLMDRVDVVHADAAQLDQWWAGTAFNAILLDAPCSGTGVVRRHPDIKLLRRASDIAGLVETQQRLLDALWQTLASDGVLLYVTCSVLKDENEHQINAFLKRTSDAQLLEESRQIFPGEQSMDGFFYAALKKHSS